jgi:hypothetical protein
VEVVAGMPVSAAIRRQSSRSSAKSMLPPYAVPHDDIRLACPEQPRGGSMLSKS